jgi:hypothetical protein
MIKKLKVPLDISISHRMYTFYMLFIDSMKTRNEKKLFLRVYFLRIPSGFYTSRNYWFLITAHFLNVVKVKVRINTYHISRHIAQNYL